MRLGTVIGRVTLTQMEPAYVGGRLLIVQPLSTEEFSGPPTRLGADAPKAPLAKGNSVVVFDQLGAREGCIVGFTEGAEATMPFPGDAPVDAYAACIVHHLDYRPPPKAWPPFAWNLTPFIMPNILTAREVEALLRAGEPVPDDVLLTPSARDFVRDFQRAGRNTASTLGLAAERKSAAKSGGPVTPTVPDYEFKWRPGSDPKTPADIERFFHSAPIRALKDRICDMGRRLWVKDYTDGNGGNITVRVGDNLVLCTPTLICKGFMSPEDICLIDLEGRQLAGARKRTSEAMTHLGIMKRQPAAKACVHAHPPHATAFAIANATIPSCLIPEAEVFLGKIGVAPYQTPGTPENADEVGKVGVDHQAILMQNHGVIVWGKDVEDAYWKMENIDSYCRTVWIAAGLGSGLHRFGPDKLKDLIGLRQKLGMPDPRAELKECELCDNAEFRPGAVCEVKVAESIEARSEPEPNPEIEALVQKMTDEILKQISTSIT